MDSRAGLPCSVRDWFGQEIVPPDCDSGRWTSHIDLLEFTLKRALFGRHDDPQARNWQVIATHSSRNLGLPIYQISPANGCQILMRTNWFDWMVSVALPRPLEIDFLGLIDPTDISQKISDLRSEGWPSGIFPSYPGSKQCFTVSVPHEHELFTFFWLLGRHFGWGDHAKRKV